MARKSVSKTLPPKPVEVQSVAFVSLGCPKNLVDSEKMLGLLAEDGLALTPNHAEADAIVINTCGFLEASKIESLEVIREAIAAKKKAQKKGGDKRIIVAGCLVQRQKAELLEAVPEVDALVGVFDREHIVKAVRGNFTPLPETGRDMGGYHTVSTYISKPGREAIGKGYQDSDAARLRLTPRHYAYLRMSEGCNQGCTFCTIPSIRGRMRSKPMADILSEAEELIADGAYELNLIGQDTTSYGSDIGYAPGLVGLLRQISKVPGVGLVRLMYAYPSSFTDDMIRALAESPKIAKYIDIPLQHIDDTILKSMRRKVTAKQTLTLLEKLRKWVPGITIRTTLITGFPGETDAQHRELVNFVREQEFECLGVFEYSPEPGTPAGRLWQTHAVPAKVSAARKEELMLAQQEIVFRKQQAWVGREVEVLVDGADRKRKLAVARHQGQAPDIDGTVIVEKVSAAPGEVLRVAITAWDGYDLIARPKEKLLTVKPHTGLSLPILGTVQPGIETQRK
jgi:ribosomal protein S12 methylthiotransferase